MKPIPRIGLHKCGRIGLCRARRRMPKEVIHVQVSFNITIVTIIDV